MANDNAKPQGGSDPQPKPKKKKSIKIGKETDTDSEAKRTKRRAKKAQENQPDFIDFLPPHERAKYRDFQNRIDALMKEIKRMEERYPEAVRELNELLLDQADFVFRMKKLYEPKWKCKT